jgi:hypothetical protein
MKMFVNSSVAKLASLSEGEIISRGLQAVRALSKRRRNALIDALRTSLSMNGIGSVMSDIVYSHSRQWVRWYQQSLCY